MEMKIEKLTTVCAHCKRVRNDEGRWISANAHAHEVHHSTITHGICPDCVDDLYKELLDVREVREYITEPGPPPPSPDIASPTSSRLGKVMASARMSKMLAKTLPKDRSKSQKRILH